MVSTGSADASEWYSWNTSTIVHYNALQIYLIDYMQDMFALQEEELPITLEGYAE